ncbi:MAG: class I SAM-dependent rRNA methyltransferase [Myxococcota bacterium]
MDHGSGMLDVVLKPGRDRPLRRRHPWVLSGSVASLRGDPAPQPGAWARVLSAEGETLGFGHYSPASSLRVRLLCFGKEEPEDGLLAERIAQAVARRVGHPLIGETDAVRLVNAEGDGLPGLTADRYGEVVVVKFTTAGMHTRRELIAAALREASGAAVGLERADATACRREGVPVREGPLWGALPDAPVAICERDRRFRVDTLRGQKTGFYLDQRDARDLVALLAAGRRMLDLFSYSGGFAVAAARGGASRLTLVDTSREALDQARRHLAENAVDCEAEIERADAFQFLRGRRDIHDLLVIDPPPLCRHKSEVARGARAYKDLFLHALRCASPGALLLLFACSHHMGPELLRKVVFGASLDAQRPLRVLRELGAPVDHPQALDHPEGAYLSGLLVEA